MLFPKAQRIRSLGSRSSLWWLLAIALVIQNLVLMLLTQGEGEAVNALVLWAGALLLLADQKPGLGPKPGRAGTLGGIAVVVVVLWRSQQIIGPDWIANTLPLLAGVGLVLLATSLRRFHHYGWALLILSLLPAMRVVTNRMPSLELSMITARITQFLLLLWGYPAQVLVNVVALPGGSVYIGGSCSGVNMLVQLVSIGAIFALAFPMRHRWQGVIMIGVAGLLAVVANGFRIALLALIVASTMPGKTWWFDFFHEGKGSLVFSGFAVFAFAWVYGLWMQWQIAQLRTGE